MIRHGAVAASARRVSPPRVCSPREKIESIGRLDGPPGFMKQIDGARGAAAASEARLHAPLVPSDHARPHAIARMGGNGLPRVRGAARRGCFSHRSRDFIIRISASRR